MFLANLFNVANNQIEFAVLRSVRGYSQLHCYYWALIKTEREKWRWHYSLLSLGRALTFFHQSLLTSLSSLFSLPRILQLAQTRNLIYRLLRLILIPSSTPRRRFRIANVPTTSPSIPHATVECLIQTMPVLVSSFVRRSSTSSLFSFFSF